MVRSAGKRSRAACGDFAGRQSRGRHRQEKHEDRCDTAEHGALQRCECVQKLDAIGTRASGKGRALLKRPELRRPATDADPSCHSRRPKGVAGRCRRQLRDRQRKEQQDGGRASAKQHALPGRERRLRVQGDQQARALWRARVLRRRDLGGPETSPDAGRHSRHPKDQRESARHSVMLSRHFVACPVSPTERVWRRPEIGE